MKTKLVFIVTGIAVLTGGTFCGWHNKEPEQQKITTLNAQEQKTVSEILTNRKSYCIGSYSIELPDGMAPDSTTRPVIRFDDINITTQRLYLPSFEQRIQLREDELRKTKPVDPINGSYLKAVYSLENNEKGVVFERMESVSVPDSARILETHLYKDSVAFTLEMKARNGENERYDKYRDEYPRLYINNVPQKLNELNNIISGIVDAKDNTPSRSGELCFPGWRILSNKIEHRNNFIAFSQVFPGNPDLYITLKYDNYMKAQESFADFKSYDESLIEKNGGAIIKKGFTFVNGIKAEEWLSKDILHNGNYFYDFYLVINGRKSSESEPKLVVNLSLENKKNANPQMSDAEMFAIWDEIINTVQNQKTP
ncbi:hypothetical protein GW579_23200 [Rahnella sp. Lac-M11]|uniref:Tle cognate immunity protein 4 C-terminal domain-containing protein n=1 Tax=Rahnella contaminans TaxID=2703882 RepID=A0A6M2B9J3_9GAMM|nr:T6SS immunity protein Tli4 family protein [Rahnella contaminans]NGX89990.1 hypothetical protein [Rahnella contaminans]